MTGSSRFGAKLSVAERRAQVIRLRQARLSHAEIAKQLGIGLSTVHRDCKAALDLIVREPAQTLIAMVDMDLDSLQRAVWAKALKGDLGAVDRALKIIEHRRKLHGLDKPIRVETTVVPTDIVDREIEAYLQGLADGTKAPQT